MSSDTATAPVTAETIRELARRELALFDAWDDENEPVPGDEWWETLDDWRRTFDPKLMPYAAPAMLAFTETVSRFLEGDNPLPNPAFWADRLRASEACLATMPKLEPLKEPAELLAEGLHPRQMAAVWKLELPNGDPDVAAMERELAKPGSVLTPEYRAKVDEWRLGQHGWGPAAVAALAPAALPPDLEPPAAITPPSLDDLIVGGANVAQIARIKSEEYGTDVAAWANAIAGLAVLMQIKLPQSAADTLNQAGREVSQSFYPDANLDKPGDTIHVLPDEIVTTLPESPEESDVEAAEVDEFDQQCLALSNQELKPAEIAKQLGSTAKVVRAAINRAQAAISQAAARTA